MLDSLIEIVQRWLPSGLVGAVAVLALTLLLLFLAQVATGFARQSGAEMRASRRARRFAGAALAALSVFVVGTLAWNRIHGEQPERSDQPNGVSLNEGVSEATENRPNGATREPSDGSFKGSTHTAATGDSQPVTQSLSTEFATQGPRGPEVQGQRENFDGGGPAPASPRLVLAFDDRNLEMLTRRELRSRGIAVERVGLADEAFHGSRFERLVRGDRLSLDREGICDHCRTLIARSYPAVFDSVEMRAGLRSASVRVSGTYIDEDRNVEPFEFDVKGTGSSHRAAREHAVSRIPKEFLRNTSILDESEVNP